MTIRLPAVERRTGRTPGVRSGSLSVRAAAVGLHPLLAVLLLMSGLTGCRSMDRETSPSWSAYPQPVTSWRTSEAAAFAMQGDLLSSPHGQGFTPPPVASAPSPSQSADGSPQVPQLPPMVPPVKVTETQPSLTDQPVPPRIQDRPAPPPDTPAMVEPGSTSAEAVRPVVSPKTAEELQAAKNEVARLTAELQKREQESDRLQSDVAAQSQRDLQVLDELSKSIEELLRAQTSLETSAAGGTP